MNKVNLIGISGKIGNGKDTVASMLRYLTRVGSREDSSFEDYLKGNHMPTFEVKKFAFKLKQIVSILTGISVVDLEKPEVKNSLLPSKWDRYVLYVPDSFRDGIKRKIPKLFLSSDKAISYNDGYLNYKLEAIEIRKEQLTYRGLLQSIGTDLFRDQAHPNIWVNALFADYKPETKTMGNRQPDDISDMPVNYPNWIITDVRFPNELKAIEERGGISIRINRDTEKQDAHISETALDDAKFDYIISNDDSLDALYNKVKTLVKTINII